MTEPRVTDEHIAQLLTLCGEMKLGKVSYSLYSKILQSVSDVVLDLQDARSETARLQDVVVELWHTSNLDKDLHECLCMTSEQYGKWLRGE